MAGRVIWSDRAKADLKDILGYWKKRNQSNIYSKYLKKKILEASDFLLEHPYSGARIRTSEIRKKPVKDYLIVYEFDDQNIVILSIFDTRQHPDKLNNNIK